MTAIWVELSELMVSKAGSVDPRKFADEKFELFSIPAFDRGFSELALGSEIGSSKQVVRPDDVMLSKIVPHIRRAWIVPASGDHRQIASGEWILFRSPRIYGPYFRHLLTSDIFNRQFMQTVAGVGGSLLRARPAQVAKIRVPLPPLDEQRRIAAILDKADELRTKRRKALDHVDTLGPSIFHAMFGDPILNPMGWPLVALSQLGTLERGQSKHRPRNDPKLLGGPHPLIQTGDVANASGYVRKFSATYSEFGLKQSKKWPAGTLCITIAANIAKTAILKLDACFPDSVVGFESDAATTEYVRTWFSFLQKTLEARAPESAQKNINLGILRILQVPAPPLDMRRRFAERVAAVEQLKIQHETHLFELEALSASLRHRAFSGQL